MYYLIPKGFILQQFYLHPFLSGDSGRPKGFTTHPKLSKDFQRSNESHFWRKIPVIIVPNFETGVNHCVP